MFKFECISDRNMRNMKFGAMATATSSDRITSTLILRLADMTRLRRSHSFPFRRCDGSNSIQPARSPIIVGIVILFCILISLLVLGYALVPQHSGCSRRVPYFRCPFNSIPIVYRLIIRGLHRNCCTISVPPSFLPLSRSRI